MKREICCPDCAKRWRSMIGKFPGENVSVRDGTAKKSFICDSCGTGIESGANCSAVTVSIGDGPGIAWESDFIKEFPKSGFISSRGPLPKA